MVIFCFCGANNNKHPEGMNCWWDDHITVTIYNGQDNAITQLNVGGNERKMWPRLTRNRQETLPDIRNISEQSIFSLSSKQYSSRVLILDRNTSLQGKNIVTLDVLGRVRGLEGWAWRGRPLGRGRWWCCCSPQRWPPVTEGTWAVQREGSQPAHQPRAGEPCWPRARPQQWWPAVRETELLLPPSNLCLCRACRAMLTRMTRKG